MKTCLRLFAAVLCIGLAGVPAGAQAPPQPLITEAFVDAETATLTFNGVGFRSGFPTVYLGNNELPVRWAHENSTATWLPELWPGTYRLIARWPDGAQADFFLTVGAIGPVGPKGDRGPEGPRGMPGFAPAGDASTPADAAADQTTTTTTTTPTGTTRYGTGALANVTGVSNSAFGQDALNSLTTGGNNSAFGKDALKSVTTGWSNSALGGGAAIELTTGVRNVAIGPESMIRQTAGSNNVAVGFRAFGGAGAGNQNVAIGYWALTHGAVASTNNTALGAFAMRAFGGVENVAVGHSALRKPPPTGVTTNTGSRNTAVGFEALLNSTGSDNIAIGHSAGRNNPAGINNIYIGSQGTVTDGSNRIYIGTQTGTNAHTHTVLAGEVEVLGPRILVPNVQARGDVQASVLNPDGSPVVSLRDTATLVSNLQAEVERLKTKVAELEGDDDATATANP